jgi:hypothetical protein
MNAEYLPKLLAEKNWPEGVKKEFVAQLHKFMAALTEASHASKGRTTPLDLAARILVPDRCMRLSRTQI